MNPAYNTSLIKRPSENQYSNKTKKKKSKKKDQKAKWIWTRIQAVPDSSEEPIARTFWIEKVDAYMQQLQ